MLVMAKLGHLGFWIECHIEGLGGKHGGWREFCALSEDSHGCQRGGGCGCCLEGLWC